MEKFDAALALALIVGLVLTGQLVNIVGSAGLTTLRWTIWILGYGGVVAVAWYVWIRPLEFRAPDSATEDVWDVRGDGATSDGTESER